MADMTSQLGDAPKRQRLEDAAIYYTVFSILFVFSLIVFAPLKLVGHRFDGGLIKAAKQAANGPAGYAVKF